MRDLPKILNMRLIAASMLCAIASFNGFAQKPSYNHDAAKMNQITVMETGAGALTPIIYYRLLHNNYQKSAAAKNKLGFRSLAGIGAYQQIEYADSIEAYLKARADVPAGGTPKDRQRWDTYYKMFQTAIKATREAYMPNAQRKREYLNIYADLSKQNEILVKQLVQMHNKSRTEQLLASRNNYRTADKAAAVASANSKWREAGLSTKQESSSAGNDTSDGGEEKVDR